MPVEIPQPFLDRLRSDKTKADYEGRINTLLANTKNIIGDRADFFPEYTLHGWTHVQEVLNHAWRLIPETVLGKLGPRDVALLIAAVIVHDLGMFLTEEGVCKLLTSNQAMPFAEYDEQAKKDQITTWKDAWERYLRRVQRYSKEQCLYQFGIPNKVEAFALNAGSLTKVHKIVVGEFLREQHHMLAFEIALSTMSGATDRNVMPLDYPDHKCIGILACSHGIPIRATWEYIEDEIGSSDIPYLTYLMAVLRIADLLDAGMHRAPEIRQDLDGIHVPASVKEWTWNKCIQEDDKAWERFPDAKFVRANPTNTTQFIQLEQWLSGVQQELDMCWAVLAEQKILSDYPLSIHRVHSNILESGQRKTYGNSYVTRKARLTANPELLKLMIAPLYGDDPSYGIRELIQNAADACREREYLEHNHANGNRNYLGEITVSLDTAGRKFVIEDNGIGMDEDILLNYYLVAGASYRYSDRYLNDFSTGTSARIIRTGKFGVGALAGFLLGETITVQTRHRDEKRGYSFQMSLEKKDLDIQRTNCLVGTKITISLNDHAWNKLKGTQDTRADWCRWYGFRKPVIRYQVDGTTLVPTLMPAPSCREDSAGWFEFQADAGYQVFWRQQTSHHSPDYVYVNGIRIQAGYKRTVELYEPNIPAAAISIIDKDDQLELNLARNQLVDETVIRQVRREQFKYFLARLLTVDFSTPERAARQIGTAFCDISEEYLELSKFDYLFSNEGYSLLYGPFINALSVSRVLHIDLETDDDKEQFLAEIRRLQPEIPVVITGQFLSGGIINLYDSKKHFGRDYLDMDPQCRAVSVWHLRKDPNRRQSIWCPYYELGPAPVWENEDYIQHSITAQPGGVTDTFSLSALMRGTHIPIIAELEVKGADAWEHRLFREVLRTYLGSKPWIPYDMAKRRAAFPETFTKLAYYIDRILADREKERGAQNA